MDKTIGLVELIYLYMHRHGDYQEEGGNFEQFI